MAAITATVEYKKAMTRLLLDYPFFGTLALRLKPIEDMTIPTASTNGLHLRYNPKWFLSLKELERVGLIAHEVMHVVLMHMTRRHERAPRKWNIAGDYVINLALKKSHIQLPYTELLDEQYDNMSTDEVYNKLPEDIGGGDGPWRVYLKEGDDPGGCGGVEDHPGLEKGDTGAIESGLEIAIQQAVEAAKARGKLPGHLQTLVEKSLAPKVDWRMILARFLRANNKSDFTWLKPNRRFIANGLYLPSLHNPCLEEIAIITDCSGSISDKELEQFTGETTAVLHELNPERIVFIQCDAEVQDHKELSRDDLPLRVTYKGRGGTAFRPAFDYINKTYPQVRAAVYLTDLHSTDFGDEPPYPVLWVTTGAEEAPFGEIIKM